MSNFWDEFEKEVAAESGGGIVAECIVEIGYKVYVGAAQGVTDQGKTWFARRNLPAEKERAYKAAMTFAKTFGLSKASNDIQITALRDGALSRGAPVTWKDDRRFNTAVFTDAAKSVVTPSIKACGIGALPWRGWARIGFVDDPYATAKGEAGMTDVDQQGNKRFPTVAYLVKVYGSKAEAYADANAGGNGGGASAASATAPDGRAYPARPVEWASTPDAEIVSTLKGILVDLKIATGAPPKVIRAALDAKAVDLAGLALTPAEAMDWLS